MDHPSVSALLRWAAVVLLALALSWVHEDSLAYGTVQQSAGQWMWGQGSTAADLQHPSCVAACAAKYKSNTVGGTTNTVSGHHCTESGEGTGNVPPWGAVPAKTGTCSYRVVTRLSDGTLYSDATYSAQFQAAKSPASCPANSVLSGGQCVCMQGYRRANQGLSSSACEPYSCQKGGLSYANAGAGPVPQESAMATRASCVGPGGAHAGCRMVFTPSSAKCADASNCWATGTDATNGEYCDGATPTDPTPPERPAEPAPPPAPCPTGQCPGSVNGLSGCYPCQTQATGTGTTKTTKTNPDGSTTETTVEKKTECVGSDCKTTTETTTVHRDPNGVIIGTPETEVDEEDEPASKFCEDNPDSPLCKQGSFGGACAGGFTCDGDAVQCAMAKEQHQRNCQMLETPTAMSQAGEAASNGQARPDGHPLNDAESVPVNFSSGMDTSDALGAGGSCPSDVTVSVSSLTLTIPWSRHCDLLNTIGELSVAVCMLAAALIVFRG